MDFRNDFQQIQTQRVSPMMIRSLNVLQVPIGELQQLIATEIQRNPFVDITDTLGHSFNLGNNDKFLRKQNEINSDKDDSNFLENIAAECSPQEYLLDQVPDIDERTKEAFITIINHLDERGFLSEDVAEKLGISSINIERKESINSKNISFDNEQSHVFLKAYTILRSLSPKGIGARNLQDCLQLQIPQNTPLYDLITSHFDDLKHRRFVKLQRTLHRTSSELRTLLVPLKRLNLAPLKIITASTNFSIIPEIIFQKLDSHWNFEIRGIPEIKMNDLYKELLIRPLNVEDRIFFTKNKQHAQFWMKSLQQRKETLQKIAQCILKFQENFLKNGPFFLRPQNQKQVAELLQIHPSTLSRAIKNKYAKTPHGIVPLIFFFSHGNHGSLIAQNALKEKIKNIIKNEDKNNTISDEKMSKILQSEDIWITRRTVTKYRAQLNIPPANIRKHVNI